MVKCEICGKKCKSLKGIARHISQAHNDYTDGAHGNIETYYIRFIKKPGEGVCPVCGKPTRFLGITYGYTSHCSNACINKDKAVRDKIRQTNINRYGCEYASQSKAIKDKIAKTNIERYGCKSPLQNGEIKAKSKQTCLNNYGVDNPMKSKAIRQRGISTSLKRYGSEYPTQNIEVKNKIKKTCLDRYGVDNPFRSEEIRSKIIKTNLERYGVEYSSQSDIVKEKIRLTSLERFGETSYLKSNVNRDRLRSYCLDNYGVDNLFESPEIKDKIRETNIKRYGCENPSQNSIIKQKIYNTKTNNGTWNGHQAENRVFNRLSSIFGSNNLLREYKCERYPCHCDFYIPSIDLFIEYNGFWTHGGHFYNSEDQEDVLRLNKLRDSNNGFNNVAADIWLSDIEKLNTAIANNLSYVVFWNENDIDSWIKDGMPLLFGY